MLTNKDFCDFDTCIALKELGLIQECSFAYYYPNGYFIRDYMLCHLLENEVYAPTLYEAQKWLREVKKIDVGASWDNDEDNWYTYIKQIGFPDWSDTSVSHSCYSSYEEALSEGLRTAVKILKEK